MRQTALALMPLARAIRSAVQWVVSVGGSANVSATTRSATSGPSLGIREGRVFAYGTPGEILMNPDVRRYYLGERFDAGHLLEQIQRRSLHQIEGDEQSEVVVDHDLAARFRDSRLGGPVEDPAVVRATAANRVIAACAVDRERLAVQLAYGVVVGTRESPGLVRAAVGAMRGESMVVDRLGPSLRGQLAGGWRVVTSRAAPERSATQPSSAIST